MVRYFSRPTCSIKGSVLRAPDGYELGEIDDVIIDIDRGRVAYFQILQGGFLGVGGEIMPVPFGALDHDVRSNSYRLSVKMSIFQDAPRMNRAEPPAWIRHDDLWELYEHFQIAPYWFDEQG